MLPMFGLFANEQSFCFNRPWQLTLYRCYFASVWKTKCLCVCKSSISLHVSICVLVGVCGWAPCQPLSDSTPSRWRIFVWETNGTERINYRHNVGDMPELPGGGGEKKPFPFPCTLRFHPPLILLLLFLSSPYPPMSTSGRLKMVTGPFSCRHQASVEHRREMAPIPDTPQKPQSHPVIRESQDPTGKAKKDTLRLGNILPLHHSVWQYFTICNLAWKHRSSCWFRVSEKVITTSASHCC